MSALLRILGMVEYDYHEEHEICVEIHIDIV